MKSRGILFQAFISDYEDSIPALVMNGKIKSPIERIQVIHLHNGLKIKIYYNIKNDILPDGFRVEMKEYFFANRKNLNELRRQARITRTR